MITLAVDCMGGDVGVDVTLPACLNFLNQHPDASLLLVGRPDALKNFSHPRASLIVATEVVEMDESPQSALKNKKDSSMRVAINLIKEEKAQACVSAGNTGALMATARYVLKMLPGIDRPAIASSLPSQKGTTYMLDLGANTDCTAENLLQFAVMGAMLVSSVTGNPKPSVGLLNIGSEDMKGNEVVRQAGELLRRSHLNFYGNVEGNDIFKGTTDVVVCDGFVGNVALKTAEGIAQLMGRFLTQEFKRNWITKSMAFVSLLVLNRFKKRLDPRRYNGASFLGLKGIVVKSHGGADSYSFFYAIRTAIEESKNNVLENIQKQLELEMPLDISSSENL